MDQARRRAAGDANLLTAPTDTHWTTAMGANAHNWHPDSILKLRITFHSQLALAQLARLGPRRTISATPSVTGVRPRRNSSTIATRMLPSTIVV